MGIEVIRRPRYEAVLGISIFVCSLAVLWYGINYIASVKVTPEMRRASVCRDEGGGKAVLFIENAMRVQKTVHPQAIFIRDDVSWKGDCNFEMKSRLRTFDGPRGFVATVHFDPKESEWCFDTLEWH